jgi:hypothetical protein
LRAQDYSQRGFYFTVQKAKQTGLLLSNTAEQMFILTVEPKVKKYSPFSPAD